MFWTILIAVVCTFYIWNWYSHRQMLKDLSKRCVFVTGCDTGFGHDLALRLDGMGVPVFAGCLTESGAKNLASETSNKVRTVLIDVSDHDSIETAYQFVLDHIPKNTKLWGVVNNAGIVGHWGPLEFLTRKDFRDIFEINFFGMVDVTKTFLPLLKESRGRIVNTASIAAVCPITRVVPYATSKCAVSGFTSILRQEKACYGINVACVLPGGFMTNLVDTETTHRRMTTEWEALPTDVKEEFGDECLGKSIATMQNLTRWYAHNTSPVIDAYVHGLFARWPRAEYTPGGDLFRFLSHFPSSVIDFVTYNVILGRDFLIKPKALMEQLKQR